MSLNEAFAKNMIGKTVKFDVQPYERGIGTIKNIIERRVKTTDYCPRRGQMIVEYDTFDIEIEVIEGSKVGSLLAGRPLSSKDTAGTMTHISGINRGQIYAAVAKGETIVIARCG